MDAGVARSGYLDAHSTDQIYGCAFQRRFVDLNWRYFWRARCFLFCLFFGSLTARMAAQLDQFSEDARGNFSRRARSDIQTHRGTQTRDLLFTQTRFAQIRPAGLSPPPAADHSNKGRVADQHSFKHVFIVLSMRGDDDKCMLIERSSREIGIINLGDGEVQDGREALERDDRCWPRCRSCPESG